MAKNESAVSSAAKTGKQILHDAIDSVKEQLAHIMEDKHQNILDSLKHAASRILKKAEKDPSPKALKRAAKRAIKRSARDFKKEIEIKPTVVKRAVKKVASKAIGTAARKVSARKKAAPAKKAAARSKNS